ATYLRFVQANINKFITGFEYVRSLERIKEKLYKLRFSTTAARDGYCWIMLKIN
ncbi:hypothetical protein K469DRAFT_528830, partial [Zopfia rhizophila CBS 207.26]